MMDDQGSVGAQLKFPTQSSATDGQEEVEGRLEEEDNFRTKVTYLDFSKEVEVSTKDSTQVLEDEKKLIQVDEEEDMTDQQDIKQYDEVQPDQVVIYSIIDETIKANRLKKKKKKKKINEDLLVRAIKKALDEESSLTADSYTHSSVASRSDDSTIYTFESGHTSLLAFKRHSRSRDESTADVTASSDDETILSGYTEDVPTTGFQNTFFWNPSPVEEQDMEDEYDYDDDDVSCDDTVGFLQDVLNCGTYSFCIGDEKSYKPDNPVSVVCTSPPLRNEERKVKSKKRLESKAMQVATSKTEDGMFQDEKYANELAEALETIFLKKDGVSNDSSNSLEENSNPREQSTHMQSTTNNSIAISEANIASPAKMLKPYLLGAVKSVSSSMKKQKSATAEESPTQTHASIQNPTEQSTQTQPTTDNSIVISEANIASSTKKVKPYLLGAVKSVSSSLKSQKSVTAEESPTQTQTFSVQTLPTTLLDSIDPIRSEVGIDIDTVPDNSEQGLQEVMSTTTKSKLPIENSFRHHLKQLKSNNVRSVRDKLTAKSPNFSKIVTTETFNEDPSSSPPTVNDNVRIGPLHTDEEIAAFAERQWKYAFCKVTGKTYYYNKFTKEVTWRAPNGFVQQKKPQLLWKTAFDATTGKEYYYNRQTKEVTWDKPY